MLLKKTTMAPAAWLLALLLLVSDKRNALLVKGQEPQDIHPYLTGCLDFGCFINWFCAPSIDLCIQCPNAFMGTTQEDCRNAIVLVDDNTTAMLLPDDMDNVRLTNNATAPLTIGSTTYYTNETAMEIDLEQCISNCVKPQAGDDCTENSKCDAGRFFCDYQETVDTSTAAVPVEDGDDLQMEEMPPKEGTCKPCKEDIRDCLDDPTIASPFGVEDCVLCDVSVCVPLHFSVTTEVNGDGNDDDMNMIIPSNALRGSPMAVGQGPLVSCSNLIHREELTCVAGGNALPKETTRQDGMVCLVDNYSGNAYYVTVVDKCAQLGGVAVVFFEQNSWTNTNETWFGSLSYLPTTIPSVSITYDDGKRWEEEHLGKVVHVNVTDVGDACFWQQFCSDDIPCVGSNAGRYCDYKWGGGNGGNGFCRTCPEDALECFFTIDESDQGKITGQKAVESCASTCASSLTFPSCKFCPQDVGGFDFGLQSESDEKCRFCPENDVLFPDKEFPLFGKGVKCWHVQKFFDSVDVNADARNCQLAQMMNYVCGCAGPGYSGASTDTKKAVLAWLPRTMALLSIIGSTFIIYDNVKSPEHRQKVMNHLLIGLSFFDLMGSCAYAFTTFPIPEDHDYGPIYGAKGNDASCTTQGFFIQMGTISAYMNVSLAVYYLLVIKYGWDERRMKKIQWALFLCPILVGFAFAFAGIPYYDSLMLWCNNTASYWPDIPVAIAIGLATVIMIMVCWDVYSKEKASAKWRGGASFTSSGPKQKKSSARASLSERVFWQSFFYLLAFYLTWPAYLALQYAWAGGSSFTNYGLILTAATLVPLQG